MKTTKRKPSVELFIVIKSWDLSEHIRNGKRGKRPSSGG